MGTGRKLAQCVVVIIATAMLSQTVRADIIDGQWCSADGRRIKIDGEYVVTPGGNWIKGEYDAHHYVFKIPAIEKNGGKEADMVLVSAKVAHIRYRIDSVEEKTLAPEVWKRCDDVAS
ncbi:MAG: hypothetical protein HKN11_19665 [Rhizobiales bacterium]|nr:hypothetical protein [Hyphomicrobiales bacterium]